MTLVRNSTTINFENMRRSNMIGNLSQRFRVLKQQNRMHLWNCKLLHQGGFII